MAEAFREKLAVAQERVLLAGVILPDSKADPADPLGELAALANTAGAQVATKVVTKRRQVSPRLYIGAGKAEEIAKLAEEHQVDTIVFDNDLSPAQIRELEEITSRKVLDRSELILDIFAAHARTAESRMQVELAQLEYTYPRLRHMWTHLERVAGGAATAIAAVGGIGTRGPGEKQLEIDRRLVQNRVSYLKRKIAAVDRRKVRQIRSRANAHCACLVGYTNAGKSTLMNLLTGADAYVADKLFATLVTKTRRWKLGNGHDALLSDTVGFIRNLPHHLVASFKATLEEAIHADLLLHVADASHPRVDEQIEAVNHVLRDLGCDQARCMLVLNKVDRIEDSSIIAVLSSKYPRGLFVSARTGQGAVELALEVARRCSGGPVRVTLRADCRNGRLMQYIARHATMQSQHFSDAIACIEGTMEIEHLDKLGKFGQDVKVVRHGAASA